MSEWVFGLHAVEESLKRSPSAVHRLYLSDDRYDIRLRSIEALAKDQGVAITRESKRTLDRLVKGRHQGVVASIWPNESFLYLTEPQLLLRLSGLTDPIVLILDGVTDPRNLGACIRSAEAAGVSAVITAKNNSASLTPAAKKVASGAAENIPLARVTNLVRLIHGLKSLGFWILGTCSDARQSLYEHDLRGPIAVVVGSEDTGMRRLTRENCDLLACLPMQGVVQSLNVSVATGVCLFEINRQRAAGID